MTVIKLVQLLRDEYFQDLRSEKEKQFVEDMFDGLQGLPQNLSVTDLDEYLTPRQIQWIRDIAQYVGIAVSGTTKLRKEIL